MSSCCARGCDEMFDEKLARRLAKRYRKRGLDGSSQRVVDFVVGRGVEGKTVLEIGGGLGEIQLELLKAGAARATTLELSPAYDGEARKLLEETGLAGRADRKLHDIAVEPEAVEPADVVVLHRVVCCYPDYERLLGAAADRAREAVVFSYPPRNAISRALVAAQHLAFRLLRKEYRAFAHPPSAMLGVLGARGLSRTFEHHGFVWQVAGLER